MIRILKDTIEDTMCFIMLQFKKHNINLTRYQMQLILAYIMSRRIHRDCIRDYLYLIEETNEGTREEWRGKDLLADAVKAKQDNNI